MKSFASFANISPSKERKGRTEEKKLEKKTLARTADGNVASDKPPLSHIQDV